MTTSIGAGASVLRIDASPRHDRSRTRAPSDAEQIAEVGEDESGGESPRRVA